MGSKVFIFVCKFIIYVSLLSTAYKDLLCAELEAGSTLSLKYTITTESVLTWRYSLENGSVNFAIKRKEATQNFTSRF